MKRLFLFTLATLFTLTCLDFGIASAIAAAQADEDCNRSTPKPFTTVKKYSEKKRVTPFTAKLAKRIVKKIKKPDCRDAVVPTTSAQVKNDPIHLAPEPRPRVASSQPPIVYSEVPGIVVPAPATGGVIGVGGSNSPYGVQRPAWPDYGFSAFWFGGFGLWGGDYRYFTASNGNSPTLLPSEPIKESPTAQVPLPSTAVLLALALPLIGLHRRL